MSSLVWRLKLPKLRLLRLLFRQCFPWKRVNQLRVLQWLPPSPQRPPHRESQGSPGLLRPLHLIKRLRGRRSPPPAGRRSKRPPYPILHFQPNTHSGRLYMISRSRWPPAPLAGVQQLVPGIKPRYLGTELIFVPINLYQHQHGGPK